MGALPPQELARIEPAIRTRRVAAGQPVTREGETEQAISIVKLGNVFGYRRGVDGVERPIGIAGRGAIFGLMGWVGKANLVTGVPASQTRVCVVPFQAIRDAVRHHPAFESRLDESAASIGGLFMQWSEVMRHKNVTRQLGAALLLLARAQHTTHIVVPSHTALAQLLGTTRETVARGLRNLREGGGISSDDGRSITLHEEAMLQLLNAVPA